MKRVYFFYCLILYMVSSLGAVPSRLFVIPRQDVQNNTLGQSLQQHPENGYRIYYQNDQFILADLDLEVLPFISPEYLLKEIQLEPGTFLYLSEKSSREELSTSRGVRLVFDLGEVALYQSRHSLIELNQAGSHKYVSLPAQPIRLPADSRRMETSLQRDAEIVQLISQISPDSVQAHVQNLEDFQTRYCLAPNSLQVAAWIRDRFLQFGIADVQFQEFYILGGTLQYNVVATIPGTENPESYVLMGAHYDSILNGDGSEVFAPGADDNATGVACLLETARVMMQMGFQPKNSIRFVAFAAEELGLYGSGHYVNQALNADQHIILAINHDMLGYNTLSPDQWQAKIVTYDGSMYHADLGAQLFHAYTSLGTFYDQHNNPSSDSIVFWNAGYPITYFKEHTYSPYMHTVQDLTVYIDAAYCAEIIKGSAATAATYGKMSLPPQEIEVADTGTGNSLQLSWNGSSDADLSHYLLYHNHNGINFTDPILIPNQPGQIITCLVPGLVNNHERYFALSAVDMDGLESYPVYFTATPMSLPRMPEGFIEEPDWQQVHFSWEANTELDLAGYHLYRSSLPDYPELLVDGLLSSTCYLDQDFPEGNRYWSYRLCAVDLDGNESASTHVIQTRPVTLNNGILIIDNTVDSSGSSPFQPSAGQVNAFMDYILAPYQREVKDMEIDVNLRLSDIGIYQSIFWHSFEQTNFESLVQNQESIRRYLELGGNIFLTTYMPSLAISGTSGYPAEYEEDSYISSVFGIGAADFSTAARFKYAQAQESGFPDLSVDPQKTMAAMNGHIFRIESISGVGTAQEIYFYGSDYENGSSQGVLNGLPVGVLYDCNPGKVIVISFPLYNMDQDDARALAEHVFGDIFGAALSGWNQIVALSSQLVFSSIYPNPFTERVCFEVFSGNARASASLSVYNLKGQLVSVAHQGPIKSGKQSFSWDGCDLQGQRVASGVYFARLASKGEVQTRKILFLR